MEDTTNDSPGRVGRLWPKSQTRRALAVASVILLAITALFIILVFVNDWFNRNAFKELADIFQLIVALIAIVIGGIFALFKLQAFRDFEPHLTVTHKVAHRLISESYAHIDVTATLHNSSKVQIELNDGFFRLQQIAPMTDEDVEELRAQVIVDEEYVDFQWRTLGLARRIWSKGELVVEPGESHPETCEFVVSTNVESVIIYTYFYNSRFARTERTAEGWHATTVHDMFNIET